MELIGSGFGIATNVQLVENALLTPISRHMRISAFYRVSVRNALAIAQVLNRTLIVPKFQCYCDR